MLVLSTIVLMLFCLMIQYFWLSRGRKRRSQLVPVDWPLFGMTPGILGNAHRFHDYLADIMKESGGTFLARGPWFANADILCTADPANLKYILSQNHSNFPRGPKYKQIFAELGEGIFNAQGEMWEFQRKNSVSLVKHETYQELLDKIIREKIGQGLIPVLDDYSSSNMILDLQDVIERYTFDTTCKLLLGLDPGLLCVGLPKTSMGKAFHRMEEGVFHRNLLPVAVWKFQGWLGVGPEKRLRVGWRMLEGFLAKAVSVKQQEMLQKQQLRIRQAAAAAGKTDSCKLNHDVVVGHEDDDGVFSLLLTSVLLKSEKQTITQDGGADRLLLESVTNLVFAGGDTTNTSLSWFFWMVATHPLVEKKIIDEMEAANIFQLLQVDGSGGRHQALDDDELTAAEVKDEHKYDFCTSKQLISKLVYLHAALCETMRLYPPVPFLHVSPAKEDILPSGHKVDPNTKLVPCLYSMARMESLWGKDCLDFKPERWISDDGRIKPIPSHVFLVFGSGPRNCLGKETAFVLMKAIIVAILHRYCIRLVQDHPIVPAVSAILHMKHGLKVRITKRRI